MAKKSKSKAKDNKNLIIGICTAVVVVLAIIITVVIVANNSGLNDSYFVSDDSKYVITLDTDEEELEGDETAALKTHLVYTYEGDKITSMKTYLEYADANAAKAAFDIIKESGGDEAKNAELNGKYIIVPADEEDYKDLTASDVKEQIEFMESLKNLDSEDYDYSDEEDYEDEDFEDEEVEEEE